MISKFSQNLTRTEIFLVTLLIFFIPTQIGYHFWPNYSFVQGFRVDYLSPTLYLTDLLLFALFVFFYEVQKKAIKIFLTKNFLVFILMTLFVSANILYSDSPSASFLKWFRLIEYSFFAFFIYKKFKVITMVRIIRTIFFSSVLFSLIGLIQTILGKTSGLWILGERSFTLSTPGIALLPVYGHEVLRSYSTFGHPNSFAGFLGISSILLLYCKKLVNKFLFILITLLLLITLVTSASTSALIALVIVVLASIITNKSYLSLILKLCFVSLFLGSLFLPIISEKFYYSLLGMGDSVVERMQLYSVAGGIISDNFWIGSGLNTFIQNYSFYKPDFIYLWLLQPVHNIYLLIFSETGVVGIVWFFIVMFKVFFKANKTFQMLLLFVLITGFFDHYWLTLHQNLLIFALLVGMSLGDAKYRSRYKHSQVLKY